MAALVVVGHHRSSGGDGSLLIMLAAMPVLIGLQLLLAFLSYDIASVPKHALSARLQVCLQEPPQ